jgi:hypothetical protein
MILLLGIQAVVHAAPEAVAEELRSRDLCQQAFLLELQRGGNPDLICSIDYIEPVFYWQCVVSTMREGDSLATARANCH